MDLLLPGTDLLTQLLTPSQSLTQWGGHQGISSATADQVTAALDALAAGHVEYVILEDDPEFLQAAGDGDGPYQLEHNPGSIEQQVVAVGPVDRAALATTMLAFLAGDPTWRAAHEWRSAGLGDDRARRRGGSEGGGFLTRLFGRG